MTLASPIQCSPEIIVQVLSLSKSPNMQVVVVIAPVFWTPRITMN